MLLHTHPDLLCTRMSKAGHVLTNTAELTSSNQNWRNLHSNARVMLTKSCQEDKDTYLAEQWHFIPYAEWKVYLIFSNMSLEIKVPFKLFQEQMPFPWTVWRNSWTVGSSFQKICLLFVLKGLPLLVSLWHRGTSETCRCQSSWQLPASISYLQTAPLWP